MSCTLIATDEAGYGPQLGPLVIAATRWEIADLGDIDNRLQPLAQGVAIAGLGRLQVSDSKQIYSPGKRRPLAPLEIAMLSVWQNISQIDLTTLAQWLQAIAPDDLNELANVPWYRDLDVPMPIDWDASEVSACDRPSLRAALADPSASLTAAAARIMPARRFNQACEVSGNKATLLSEQTVQLAMPWIAASEQQQIEVFCDKHGGRSYYGALLQHYFPDGHLTIEAQGRATSRYQIQQSGRSIRWHFTAKGDRFIPVALSSMIAKYTRERLMGQFNSYWQRFQPALKPTAGYPGDAKRFLDAIEAIRQRESIDLFDLVRNR